MNKKCIVAGIRNLCRTNYNVDPRRLDLHSMVDSSLSMRENWYKIKPKVLRLSPKKIRGVY